MSHLKGPVSPRSHSWTHALPSGDITPRLLPWAPVLPLDKCRPLSWGCWSEWQLCHMSLSPPEARRQQDGTQSSTHVFMPVLIRGLFISLIYIHEACMYFQTKSSGQSAQWIKVSFGGAWPEEIISRSWESGAAATEGFAATTQPTMAVMKWNTALLRHNSAFKGWSAFCLNHEPFLHTFVCVNFACDVFSRTFLLCTIKWAASVNKYPFL